MPPVKLVFTGTSGDNDLDARLTVPGQGRTVTQLADYLANNATFTPLDYGAKGDGVTDDRAAIVSCVTNAVAMYSAGLLAGRPVVDLRGRNYLVNAEAACPPIPPGGLIVQNGKITAGPGFDVSTFLMSFGRAGAADPVDNFRVHDLIVQGVAFDAKNLGGGLYVQSYMRVKITQCEFWHYGATTPGLRLGFDKNGGHEAIVRGCQFGEYLWGEPGHAFPQAYAGTSLEMNTPDNLLSDCVMQYSKVGLKLNAQYNIIRGLHCYMGGSAVGPANTGIWITASAAYNTLSQLYVDGCEILWELPWNTSITNSKFLVSTADTNFIFIRIRPTVGGASMRGVVVTGNSFQASGAAAGSINVVKYDNSTFAYNNAEIKRVVFDGNGFEGCKVIGSRWRKSVSLSASDTASFDFSAELLPFGTPRVISVALDAPTVTPCQVTARAGSVFTVKTGTPVTGTVYMEATCVQVS